jgi:pimeloyl-ACP methyl ester carboxylesterase
MVSLETWRASGEHLLTPDGRVFMARRGPAQSSDRATPALVLHGFPTSSWDFAEILGPLSTARPVVTFDFLGFGLSDKPESFGYSLFEHADVATLVARAQKLERVHLVAHDMGTSVATELLARRERGLLPFEIASLTLMNGSVHPEMSDLTIGQRILRSPLARAFAKLNNRRTFKAQIRRVFAKPVSDAEIDAMWELVARENGADRLPQTIRYIEERYRFERRWIGALEHLDLPALIAWGKKDPVAIFAIAEKLSREIPGAKLVTWDDLGHYPQVEDPVRVAETIGSFLASAR